MVLLFMITLLPAECSTTDPPYYMQLRPQAHADFILVNKLLATAIYYSHLIAIV